MKPGKSWCRKPARLLTAAISSAAAAVTAAPAATAITAAAAATAAAGLLRTRFVDGDGSCADGRAVQLLDCGLRFGIVDHLDEGEPLGMPGVAVDDQLHAVHLSDGREHGMQLVLGHIVRQTSHKQFLSHFSCL